MPSVRSCDVVIIGGGIVGLATARAVLRRNPRLRVSVLEKEPQVASHQTGRNSGVMHSGVYYKPGSLKARLCTTGVRMMEAYCDAQRIPFTRCGKVIVATHASELPRLEALWHRGQANKVPGLSLIGPEQLAEIEPHVQGVRALHVPNVAIVDYAVVARALASEIETAGGRVVTRAAVRRAQRSSSGWQLETEQGGVEASFLINCSGLHSDRVGRAAGDSPPVRIIPFRGEYYHLAPGRESLVNGLVYPVPDPSMPFLGVHFTKTLSGGVHVGPNAVLALKREGYRKIDWAVPDLLDTLAWPGFWGMAQRFWKAGWEESCRSWLLPVFVRSAQRLVPAVTAKDLVPAPAGVRAQAVDRRGALADDFVLQPAERALHVYNAPSPAATASLAIADDIVSTLNGALS